MSIIDPIFTGLLVLGLFLSAVIGHRRPAAIALALAVLYVGFGVVQHERAARVQEQLAAARNHTIERGRVMPTLGNLVVWRSIYESDGILYADAIRPRLFDKSIVREGQSMPRATIDDVLALAGSEPTRAERIGQAFGGLDAFATGFTAIVANDADTGLIVGDVRYSLDTAGFEPLWGLHIGTSDAVAPVQWAEFMHKRSENRLKEFWYELLEPGAAYAPIATAP